MLMEPGARPIQVKRVPKLLREFPPRRTNWILDLARSHEKPSPLILPAAARRKGSPLVLDGCHRLAALSLVDDLPSVYLCVVEGPPTAEMVIDLELGRR